MATAPAPRWQRLDHNERRRQILACARRLFSERNYAAVSTAEIAREAGVARGLLHHYFGTKRDLHLEVVRTLVRMPSNPVPLPPDDTTGARSGDAGGRAGRKLVRGKGLANVIDESVERWLTMLEHNRGTWLAAIGARGLGRDAEVEAILDEARERAADRLIEALQSHQAAQAPAELRATIRAYSGFAEAASVEWLERGRLSRAQIHALLVQGFLSIVRDVLPAVQRADPPSPLQPRQQPRMSEGL